MEGDPWERLLDTDIAFTIVSAFVKLHESRASQFDIDYNQLVDQFNKKNNAETQRFHEKLLNLKLAADVVHDAVLKFNSSSISPVSYPKSRPGHYQDVSTQVSDDILGHLNTSSTASSSKTTTSQFHDELFEEPSHSTDSNPPQAATHKDGEDSTIFVQNEQNLPTAQRISDNSPTIVLEDTTLPRDRTPSADRPLTTNIPGDDETIHDSQLPTHAYAFINLEVPDRVYVTKCPGGNCKTEYFTKNPFRYSRAIRHFIKHHRGVFRGAEPSEKFIFRNYSVKVLGVNEKWVAKRSNHTKYVCDLSEVVPKRNPRKSVKSLKRRKQNRSDHDPALQPNPPSPILGSVEQSHKSREEIHEADIRRSSRSVPSHCYQESTEPCDIDPYEDDDMGSSSEADHPHNGFDEDFSGEQLDDATSHTQDSTTNASPEPGIDSTATGSLKRTRVSSEDEEIERLTVKLKYNSRRFDATQKHNDSTTESNHPNLFESNENLFGERAQGIYQHHGNPRSEESRIRPDRDKYSDPIPRRSAPS